MHKVKSIKNKLLIAIVPLIVMAVTAVGIIGVINVKSFGDKVVKKDLENGENAAVTLLDQYFWGLESRLITMGGTGLIQTDIKNNLSEHIYANLQGLKGFTDVIVSTFVMTDNQSYIYPKTDINKHGMDTVIPIDMYKKAMSDGSTWVGPRKDPITGETILSVAVRFESEGKPAGVLGMNINIKDISVYYSEKSFSETGYSILLDADGTVISDRSDMSTVLKKYDNEAILNAIADPNTTNGIVDMDGVKYLYQKDVIGQTDWFTISFIAKNENSKAISVVILTIIIALLVIIAATIFVISKLATYLESRLKNLASKLAIVGSGNLDVVVEHKGEDEIDQMAISLNQMVDNFKSTIVSTVDVTNNVNDNTEKFLHAYNGLTESAKQVSDAMVQMSNVANEQATDADNISNKINSFGKTVENISIDIDNIYSLCEKTESNSKDGMRSMNSLVKSSEEAIVATEKVDNSIRNVEKSSKEVEGIIVLIKDIANKTNLLSLNASIEAARAGEAGKGFAVVAEEIRNLAEQSKDATESIEDIISKITNIISETVLHLESITNVIQEQNTNVKSTQESFEHIFDSVITLNENIKVIEALNKSLINEKNDVNGSICNLVSAVEETSSSTEEVTAYTQEQLTTMEELSIMINGINNLNIELKNSLNKFKY